MAEIVKVGRVLVPVSDQDAAIDYYTKTLGFTVVADVPFGEGSRWIEVAPPDGEVKLALVPPQGEFTPGRMTGIGFSTADARAAHAALAAKGVALDGELLGGDGTVPPLFFFRDPDGNHFLVAEE